MPVCSAFQCKNKGTHRFPSDEKKRKLWIKAMRKRNWRPNSSNRLCSNHFKPNDFYDESRFTGLKHQRKNLKKEAVPSLFSFPKLEAPNSMRQQTYEARSAHTSTSNQTLTNDNIYIAPHSSQEKKMEDTVPIPDIGCEVAVQTNGNLTDGKN